MELFVQLLTDFNREFTYPTMEKETKGRSPDPLARYYTEWPHASSITIVVCVL